MPGTGKVRTTGRLGDVMKESASIAVSWLRANAAKARGTGWAWAGDIGFVGQ
jgi:ATP-dependent Lon protease